MKDADGLVGIIQASARGRDTLADNFERVHLSDDPLAEKCGQREDG